MAIENSLFYKQVAKEYDMVYSSELVYCSSTQKWGIQGRLQLLDDTTGTTYFVGNNYDFPNAFDLFAYPKLAYADYPGFFSIYHKRLLDNEPTSLQLAYCRNGERLSDKILNLKKNVNAVSKEDILNYILHFRQHDNRIVSAVVEKRHFVSCFMFANVLQSDDKLWALKYRDVEEGKKVLIIYDISSPHLFFVIDWNPSDEDYEYYNTKEGKNPTFKYLLKLEHLSTKLQPSNDEEELMVDD
ncbi:MAG: hypothetical protein Q4B61_09035 [Bacteroidales bacterium]|nr:hypothetical protein [Bacteroidales bacterium]